MNYPPRAVAGDSLIFSLLHATQSLEARLESAFATVGLSAARFGVLDQLVRAGEPLALSDLAARLSCVRSNMTQLVDRLEEDGLVRRANDPRDRRSIRAELTDAGYARHSDGLALLEQVQTWFDTTVPEPDRAALERVIEVLE